MFFTTPCLEGYTISDLFAKELYDENFCSFFNLLGKVDSLTGKLSNILLILKRTLVRNIDDGIKYDLKKDTDK